MMGAPHTDQPKQFYNTDQHLTRADLVPIDEMMMGLLEQSRDCVKILGMEGTLDFMNCGGNDPLELDDFDGMRGKVWWTLWPSHTQKTVRTSFERALMGREVEFAAECPTVQGDLRKWIVNLKPMLTADGNVVGVLCTSRDLEGDARSKTALP